MPRVGNRKRLQQNDPKKELEEENLHAIVQFYDAVATQWRHQEIVAAFWCPSGHPTRPFGIAFAAKSMKRNWMMMPLETREDAEYALTLALGVFKHKFPETQPFIINNALFKRPLPDPKIVVEDEGRVLVVEFDDDVNVPILRRHDESIARLRDLVEKCMRGEFPDDYENRSAGAADNAA